MIFAMAKAMIVPDPLSASERRRMLRVVDILLHRRPSRPASEVDAEIREVRRARRRGGRRAIVSRSG